MKVVCDAFVFQPANVGRNGPPGIVASMTSRLPSVVIRMRTPLVNGSNGGAYGYGRAISPLNLNRSSPGGVLSRLTVIAGFVAYTGMMLLHGSQASPLPSLSASSCPGFETVLQLSDASQTPSLSMSWTPTSAGQAGLLPSQVSAGSQVLVEARQTKPFGRKASAGQLTLDPSQFSAMSQPPAAGRHTVLEGSRESGGQLLAEPSQLSAGSQAPADGRQTAVLLASAGQAAVVPVQFSAGSHTPAEGRHTVVDGLNASVGQSCVVPSQFSATSHGPATGRQVTKAPLTLSAGQVGPVPVQFSATSQSPLCGRQTTVLGLNVSAGQFAPVPVQFSATSQTPAEARHSTLLDLKPLAGHVLLLPVQFSSTSQSPAAGRHTAPALPAGCWQASLEPSHSSTVHGLVSLEHAVPAGLLSSAGQFGPVPVQFSAGSHSPAEARHSTKGGRKPSAGQVVLDPVHVSTSSQSPAARRQTAPAFPPGSWHFRPEPSHSSTLHGLPSPVHAVPAGLLSSAGQLADVPVQFSAGSHSPAEARHTTKLGRKSSGGQTVLVPVQFSSISQGPAAGRHTAPAFPAGCWQASFVPSHSSRLHGLPSLVHAVPAGSLASAGHVGPRPVQLSAGTHSPAEARRTAVAGVKASAGQTVLVPVQFSSTSHAPAAGRQPAPALPAGCWQASFVPSHSSRLHGLPSLVHAVPAGSLASAGHVAVDPVQFSAGSHSPADARQSAEDGRKTSAGQVLLVPVQVSSRSQSPAAGRQTVPAFPAGCWQASFVPSHRSVVHGLPSSVQSEPAAFLASGGQFCPRPAPLAAASPSAPAAGRQAKTVGRTMSGGHVEVAPVHTSSGSHTSPDPARQTVPALPAAC